jgi:hypothetical protein
VLDGALGFEKTNDGLPVPALPVRELGKVTLTPVGILVATNCKVVAPVAMSPVVVFAVLAARNRPTAPSVNVIHDCGLSAAPED